MLPFQFGTPQCGNRSELDPAASQTKRFFAPSSTRRSHSGAPFFAREHEFNLLAIVEGILAHYIFSPFYFRFSIAANGNVEGRLGGQCEGVEKEAFDHRGIRAEYQCPSIP